jgi:class 3 adenylate cyclase
VTQPTRTIRFTTTEDGADIAFWEIGDGKPLVIVNNFGISHSESEWTVPSMASFFIEMSERYRVIRYDPRGCGLSGEPPGGWSATTSSGAHEAMSTDRMGLDILAVATALDLDGFALMGLGVQGPVVIEYTATHPEVTELILCDSMAAVATSHAATWLDSQKAVGAVNADTGVRMSLWRTVGPPDEADRLAALALLAGDYDSSISDSQMTWDAEHLLVDISVPTLVIVSSAPQAAIAVPSSRHLASGISDAHLRVVDGFPSPYWTDRTATLDAIDSFLKPAVAAKVPSQSDASFRTVVFTDIVGSTEYVRRVGDEAGRAAIRRIEQQVEAFAGDHDGRVVKNLGDGSLVSFGSNSSAISFALNLQDACSDGPLRLRIGMTAGEPIQEDGDIHGTVVAHASRIGDLGDAGEVIVSDSVRQLAAGKGFSFESRGEVSLKGFDEAERVWRVAPTTSA